MLHTLLVNPGSYIRVTSSSLSDVDLHVIVRKFQLYHASDIHRQVGNSNMALLPQVCLHKVRIQCGEVSMYVLHLDTDYIYFSCHWSLDSYGVHPVACV
jgi:hypothetical protein